MSTVYYLISPKFGTYMVFDDIAGCCPPYERARAYRDKLLSVAAEFADTESVEAFLLHLTGDAADACKDTAWAGAREDAIRFWLTTTRCDPWRHIVSDDDDDAPVPLGWVLFKLKTYQEYVWWNPSDVKA